MALSIVHLIKKRLPPEATCGGANRSVDWLAKAQADAGHRVTVACPAGHDTEYFKHRKVPETATLSEALGAQPDECDIIHLHSGYEVVVRDAKRLGKPFIQTVRSNGAMAMAGGLRNAVFLSNSHMGLCGGSRYVYNGIPLDAYIPSYEKQGYLLFLAKVQRAKKGVDTAVRLAKKLKHPLVIAGGRRLRVPETWFPTLPGANIVKSVGPVDGEQKLALLAGAKALLVPIRWDEPFGLTIPEALASGTPVIASRRGALPELIEDGKTGFLCDNVDELEAAVARLDEIDPQDCRNAAVERFGIDRVQHEYEALYRQVIDGAAW